MASYSYPASGPSLPVSLANGGTGQTTANAALNALQALASGQNSQLAFVDAITAGNPTTTADIISVLKHTSAGNAGNGFGAGWAVDLQSGAGTLRRALTDVTTLTTVTDAAEYSRRTMSVLAAGSTLEAFSTAYVNSTLAAIFVGPNANGMVIRADGATFQMLNAGSTGLSLTSGQVATVNAKITCDQRLLEKQGAGIASGSTLTCGNDGNYFHITGTTAINHITTTNWQAGARIELYFESGITINHNTGAPPGGTNPIRLVGSVNLTAAAGSKLTLRLDSTLSQWVEVSRSGA